MDHIIWDNDPSQELFDAEEEAFKEDYPDGEYDDKLIWDLVYETIENNLGDEEMNLDKEMSGEIFLIGTFERWNGTHHVYKGLKTRNIGKSLRKAIESFSGNNTFEIGVDNGKMILTQLGHDNPTNPTILEFRSVTGYDTLDDLVFTEDSDSIETLMNHSASPVEEVCKVYGWEVAA